ncbi:MAG TPA: hypothetical protein VFE55_10290 [Acidimicrobiia bacterium]|nr:hypothetical protein [Acidimicrobiia bacterium]
MSSVLDPPRPSPARAPRRVALIAVVAVVAALALVLAAQQFLPSPATTRRITVDNPTPFHLEIDADGTGSARAVTVGAIGREQAKTFDGVIDQGGQWIFRFSSGGTDGGEMRVSRAQLEANGWKITVADDVARRLQAAGVPPSPRE